MASISLTICKGSINLKLYCSADSTYKKQAKASSTAGQEQGSVVDSGVPTKFCPPPVLGIGNIGIERRKMKMVKRAFAVFTCSLINPPSVVSFSSLNPCAVQLHLCPELVPTWPLKRERQALVRAWLME